MCCLWRAGENLYLSLRQIQVFSCWRRMCNFSFPPYMPHFLLWLINHTPVKIINKACIKLYDHVEQFISSSTMSKVVVDNKLPNKSVNRLPYGPFTLRWQNNPPFKDICLYSCHCFQHYLVIYFEVNDLYIALF